MKLQFHEQGYHPTWVMDTEAEHEFYPGERKGVIDYWAQGSALLKLMEGQILTVNVYADGEGPSPLP